MATQDTLAPFFARTDSRDWLLEADGPLAALQVRAGGELPGIIAAPALLELVRKARTFGLRLSRRVEAQGDGERISAWVDVQPQDAGAGCELRISDWRATPCNEDGGAADATRRAAIARDLAELTVRLGPSQEVLLATAHSPDTAATAERMTGGAGRHWAEFVTLEMAGNPQEMGWRALDGLPARLGGSDRSWTVHFHPLGQPEPGSGGFELSLVATEPLATSAEPEARAEPGAAGIGRELAPVLRQPVARIIANAETIRTQLAGPLAEEYANYAADIASAGEHLLALIEDLSDLEAVEDAHFTTIADQIDLADIARRAAGILAVRAQQKDIAVAAPVSDARAPAVGEFKRALQIVLNLLGNAIRYSPTGGRVWLRVETDGGELARLIVADEGEGIEEDAQRRVFEKFERLGRSGDGGSGLGLYISRRLALAMGGDLRVESTPGEGARFILELPADTTG